MSYKQKPVRKTGGCMKLPSPILKREWNTVERTIITRIHESGNAEGRGRGEYNSLGKGKITDTAETLLTNDRVYHMSPMHGGLGLSGAIGGDRKESW